VQQLAAELVVVLNCGADAVRMQDVEHLESRVSRLLFEPRAGKSHALNAGVSASHGEVIAFTDDDTEPAPDWLHCLTRPLFDVSRPRSLVGCGGRVTPVYPEGGVPDWYRGLNASRPSFLGPQHEPSDAPFEYELGPTRDVAPLGANCAYRREVFEKLRFDPELGPNRETGLRGGEDTLLACQALQLGLRILHQPEARVRHPVPASRLTMAHVLEAHFYQGIEIVRLERAVGDREFDLDRTRRRLRRLGRKFFQARITSNRSRLVSVACRYEVNRGIAVEVDGAFRRGEARPLDSRVAQVARRRFDGL
jgi:cellulose synthase/poly-beta-1,6-N-acetylglucosamine synthase-like glycosyltransferase